MGAAAGYNSSRPRRAMLAMAYAMTYVSLFHVYFVLHNENFRIIK